MLVGNKLEQEYSESKPLVNVLIVHHYFPHYRYPVLRELACQKNIHYTFISGLETDTEIKLINPEVAFLPTEKGGLDYKIIKNIWITKDILWQGGVIKESLLGKYDCVIFLGSPYYISTWIGMILSRLLGKKVFLWTHGMVRGNSIKDNIRIIFFKLANGLLLYGNWSKNNLASYGFNKSNMYVIYNSLDHDKQFNLRKSLNLKFLASKRKQLFKYNQLPVLLFIGRLEPRKRLDFLINAASIIHQRGLPVNLLIIGDGRERHKLCELTKQKGLDDYSVFYGECYDETELAPLIALADICVSPGDVGLTAMHSLTFGTPVITHNNPLEQMPEFEAIIEGVNGMFYIQGSIESLADAIHKWLNNHSLDREQVREKCYEVIDRYYTPENQVKIINSAIISKVLNEDQYVYRKSN